MTQEQYIEILAADLQYNREQRNDKVSSIVGRKVRFLDEMTTDEKMLVISHLKELKRKP